MMYKPGNVLRTTKGKLTVQWVGNILPNDNPKYNHLGNKTIYWLLDEGKNDIFIWNEELERIIRRKK